MFGCVDIEMVTPAFDTTFKIVKYWARRAMNWHNCARNSIQGYPKTISRYNSATIDLRRVYVFPFLDNSSQNQTHFPITGKNTSKTSKKG
jgi:hypothetical protein